MAAPAASLTEEDRRRQATSRALRLIASRARTESDLRSRLAPRFAAEDIDHAVARLRAIGYIDDAAWAADYVGRDRAQQRSATLLRRELLARGVSAGDADEALSEHDDHAAALRAARRRLPALRRLDPRRRSRRLRDYLQRRGFGQSVVESALAQLPGAAEGAR